MGLQHWPDSFLSVFDANLSRLQYSTLLGGGHSDLSMDLALSPDEAMLAFVGVTVSDDIAMEKGCFDDVLRGYPGIFLHTFDVASWNITYSTYIGGSTAEMITSPANVLSIDDEGFLYLAIQSRSEDLPTTHRAFQPDLCQTDYDVGVLKLEPQLCPRAPAPHVEVSWGHMFVDLSWNLTPYERCRLKEVRVCMTRDGQPRTCGKNENQRKLCAVERMYVPPVRSSAASRSDPPAHSNAPAPHRNPGESPLPGPRM